MKKIFLLFILILSINLINASAIYQQGKDIDLKFPFEVNGSRASTSAQCNISIKYPNSSYIIKLDNATNLGNGEFNYTLNSTKTGEWGTYEWTAFCCDLGNCAAGYGEFEVTTTGNELSIGESIIYIIILVVLIFAFLLFLTGSIKLPFKDVRNDEGSIISINDLKYLKVSCMVFAYLTLMAIFGIMRQISANFLYLNDIYRIFQWMFWFMLSLVYPLIILSVLFMLIVFINSKKMQKFLERGVPMR